MAAILHHVRTRGDDAVAEYTRKFDGREPPYEVTREKWDELAAQVQPRVREALQLAASRIRAFHEHQREPDVDVTLDGVRLELRVSQPTLSDSDAPPLNESSMPPTALK